MEQAMRDRLIITHYVTVWPVRAYLTVKIRATSFQSESARKYRSIHPSITPRVLLTKNFHLAVMSKRHMQKDPVTLKNRRP